MVTSVVFVIEHIRFPCSSRTQGSNREVRGIWPLCSGKNHVFEKSTPKHRGLRFPATDRKKASALHPCNYWARQMWWKTMGIKVSVYENDQDYGIKKLRQMYF